MEIPAFIIVTCVSALHIVCYGLYKDSPYEKVVLGKIVREFILCFIILSLLVFIFSITHQSLKLFILYPLIVVSSRIVTEAYKQFFRTENQDKYKIPSQVHLLKVSVKNKYVRWATFLFFPVIIGSGIFLAYSLKGVIGYKYQGFMIGMVGGLLFSLAGAYKDGFYEGFDLWKFFRSPIVAGILGWFVSFYTGHFLLIMFTAMGLERMMVEFYKTFLKAGYVPGKFKENKAPDPFWLKKRALLKLPYLFSWVVLITLFVFHA